MVESSLLSPHPGCLVPSRAEAPRAKFKPAASTEVLQFDGARQAYLMKAAATLPAGEILKGLTAILVGHLLLNQNVSSISCPPEASGPRFLCLLQA